MERQCDMDQELTEIYILLFKLGVTANYIGFYHTAYAVYLTVQDIHALQHITKQIYPEVAKRFHTTGSCVERNIRTVVDIAWQSNPAFLEVIAQYPISHKPTNGQFIAHLAKYLIF